VNDPALLELFTCLREADLPLGLAEYYLLLEATHAGFGTRDRNALGKIPKRRTNRANASKIAKVL